MLLYDEAKLRLKELIELQKETENALRGAPPGKIRISRSHHRIQFYLRNGIKDKSGKYLPLSQKSKIKSYLQKSYNEKLLENLSTEISNLTRFIENESDSIKLIQNIYSSYPTEIKSFIAPVYMSDEDFVDQWQKIPFDRKDMSGAPQEFVTLQKECVRSKSELNIANELYRRGIPYKYECPLVMKDRTVIYPDFTILDVRSRKEKYWEHRGMMDDREYARHAVNRMKLYLNNGYYTGDSLIITEETSSNPLGTREISAVIKHYFE